jgi:selenide,water dikinase
MHPAPLPLTRDIVLIGGGHSHALVLRRWGMQPLPGARLTLVNPGPTAPYTGMLPGHIAGHYGREALEIDLVRLARHAGARLILGAATAIDRAARTIAIPGRAPIGYDVLSLDVGITSDMPGLPGFAAHGVPVKPLADFAARWRSFMDAPDPPRAPVVVIGGGVAGVEVAMAMAWRLRRDRPGAPGVTVIEAADTPLGGVGAGARRALLQHMAALGITVVTGARAARIEAGAVVLGDGRRLPSSFTLGATGARPHDWLRDTGLHLTDGFVTVDECLRSHTDPSIFAVGDCAHMAGTPRPKAGVFAVRQAPVLWQNLRAAAGAGRMRAYRPQRDYLKLVATGGMAAVADKFGLRLEGPRLWWLKDRIDARFMARLAALPPMPAPPLPEQLAEGVAAELAGARPLCGGCGAKVGAQALRAALARAPLGARDDLDSGPGDDAAILRLPGGGTQVITTDHLRPVTEDFGLMARIAAHHALGDIWAMGAAPQVALMSLTLPRMSAALQRRTLDEIMQAAADVFGPEGAAIAGGHTALGPEASIGFAITGLIPAGAAPRRKGGAVPGCALILTKAIGSGTIMAAEMQRAAPGPVVAGAWAAMARSQGPAARLLAPHARAMTDVTGFGLAGHLAEMLGASGCGATLDGDAIPMLEGAAALAAEDHASSLAPDNRAALAGVMDLPDGPLGALLVDPQTSGGLLAAVPDAEADALVTALRAAGYDAAARIGTCVAGPPRISLR